jgi:tetratricopeptide (TPR) repeat protein
MSDEVKPVPDAADEGLNADIEAVSEVESPHDEAVAAVQGVIDNGDVETETEHDLRAAEAIAAESVSSAPTKARLSLWQRLFGNGKQQERTAQIAQLTHAIESAPDDPTNYVLRGEMYLRVRDYAAARNDFQRGLDLAAEQVRENRWGIIAQAMQDRAMMGLDKLRRHGT